MIDTSTIKIIYDHAIQDYPNECCGIVSGDGKGFAIVHKCKNIQNELHGKDPVRYTRDARTAYYIDPRELIDIFHDAEKKGLKIIAFYHSHPNHAAYFSQEDRDLAMFGDEPSYPDAEYIVVSLFNESVNEVASFKWDDSQRDFLKRLIV
ncbi:MAG: M67 family metallopeptidase [Nitrospinae bacterium]|nr:M67 family metallopeptidase [Nitrospinota bacterium]